MRSSNEHAVAHMHRLLRDVVRDPETLNRLAPHDLDLAIRAARRAGVLGQIASRTERYGDLRSLPQAAIDQLVSSRLIAQARQRAALWELDRVLYVMARRSKTRVVVLKGCAYLLGDLPNSGGRSLADVDLLFDKSDLTRVEALLLENGWRSAKLSPYDQHYYRRWTHELPPLVHAARKIEVDLHHNILPPTAKLAPPAERLLEDAVPIPGTNLYRLSDVDVVVHASTHLFYDSDLANRLRDLMDVDALLRHFSRLDDRFCVRVAERAIELDLGRPVYYALRYAARWLATPVSDEAFKVAEAAAPSAAVVALMDRLVGVALFPDHPDRPGRAAAFARYGLYLRSHWIRMPPWLLTRHLGYKLYRSLIERFRGRRPIEGERDGNRPSPAAG